MKKFILIVIILCYGVITTFAQDSQGGVPPSFELKNISQDIDLVQVQPPDMALLMEEDNDRAAKSEPYRIGITLPVDLSIINSGTWTEAPSQNANIWRLTVKSEGAKAIGLGYASFYLPEGAKLFLYNKDRSMVIGAYTSLNNSDNYFFVNEKVKGDEITLELFLPNEIKNNVFLHITELNYFYRQPENNMAKLSGSCEVNINCSPEGDNWQDEKKGVCLIDIKNGSYWFNCSGSLVNNTSLNCTPYVLLADHCHYYNGYPSSSDYNSWVFNFHYESSTCAGTTASGTFTKTGCTLKAHDTYGQNDVGSDFCLVQISSAITQDVYYNGWDRNNTASASGVGIHHPDADIMKISTYTSALTSYNYGGTGTHWRVVWAATTNGHGVTEQGSSGSPIFNSTGKIVGTLTGGSSYCSTPTNPDYYGKVYYHWDQNGTTADKRLKDWLDPTNTGATSLAGMASCSSCTPPTTQATSFTSSSVTNTSMTVGWTRGNGTGGVIVVARAGSAVNANPVNGTSYTASATFGSGTQIGTANYVVYKGTGTSVNVTGLSAGTAYYYAVYEYNTTGTCYKTPALTGNATTTGSSGTTCDTLTNILPTDTLTLYGFGGSNWGTWTGHNSYSFSEFAEHYTGVTSSSISGLEVFVGTAFSGATGGNHKVTFNVYQGGTTPGTVLGSTDVALTTLNDYAINYITFPTPVAFTGTDVYVGYTIYYNTPADTFNVAQTTSSLTNSGFVKYSGSWYSFSALTGNALVSAIYVSPIICTSCNLPAAAGSITGSPSVCQGQNNVAYTVPAITDASSYIWSYSGTGATISGSSNSVSINFSASATSGNLTVMGTNACGNGPVSANYPVSVNPTPTVTVPANISVCNNGAVAATSFTSTPTGGTFTWTNSNTAIGLAASGSGNIASFTAANTGTTPISSTITVTPYLNGCVGTPSSYTITVNPTPTVTVPANISVCNNGAVAATSFTSTPTGGTFTWTNSNTAIGLAASGTGNIAAFTATNTGTTSISATITVTPTVNGCAGTPSSYTITVKPTPSVTVPANISVCNNGTVAATSFTSTPSGGTFTWTNSNTAIGLAASGSGNIASFTATNIGTAPISATITVTTTVNGCAGTPSPYTITVNPLPTAEAGANATYTGTPVQIGDPSNGPGTFSWLPVAGLSNPSIAAPLASPTVSTTYTLTVMNNGCTATDAVTITTGNTGHNITGKTRYAAKANAGYPAPNPATYNSVIYNIDQVIVILKTSLGAEIARDTSDALGNYNITNIPDGNYILSYDKYTTDSMQWCNDVNAIDLALIKYYIGSDTVNDPSRNFYPKYRKAANVDNNTAINAIDISRMKAKIGSPYNVSKNFPKGNWVALDTSVTIAGADLNLTLKTISYGDYNASSTKYRDSLVNWNMTKSLPENIITVSDEYITTSNHSYFEVPLYINADLDDFSALGLELKYPDNDYQLVHVFMPNSGNKNTSVKINPSLEEILANNDDLLITDEDGVIRVVFATSDHFDVAAHDEMIRFGFRSLKNHTPGELDFSLSGTGVIGDQYGREKDNMYLLMPKFFIQGNNTHAGFELSGYPNPFSDRVTIYYNIPEEGNVSINVYNSLGETVLILKNETQQSGRHLAEFSGKYLSSGIYTIKLEFTGQHNSGSNVLKMIR